MSVRLRGLLLSAGFVFMARMPESVAAVAGPGKEFQSQPASRFQPPVCAGLPRARPHPSAAEMRERQQKAADDPSFLLSPEPVENIGTLRFQLREYADCTGENGCYWADLDAQTRRAMDAIENRVKSKKRGERLAMVLDIDETSLTGYCENTREDYGYIRPMYESWIVSEDAAVPIDGTLRLFRRARELGVEVFFITGREEAQRAATERNLRRAGYEGWKHLSLKQAEDHGRSTESYKSGERARIAAEGYAIILNMGDQWNDLEGAPLAERSVKLPNPFYYLP